MNPRVSRLQGTGASVLYRPISAPANTLHPGVKIDVHEEEEEKYFYVSEKMIFNVLNKKLS